MHNQANLRLTDRLHLMRKLGWKLAAYGACNNRVLMYLVLAGERKFTRFSFLNQ